MKRIVASTCLVAILLASGVSANSSASLLNVNIDADAIVAAPSQYISFTEYVNKYGEKNVLDGFSESAAENRMEIASRSDSVNSAYSTASIAAEADLDALDLYNDLSDGEFLGLAVLGVTDVAPGSSNFMIWVDDDTLPSSEHLIGAFDGSSPAAINSVNIVPEEYYDVFYQSTAPDDNAINLSYEELAGSYFYKYAYAFDNNCIFRRPRAP